MESLQLSQVLADLSNLRAAEPRNANTIVTANNAILTNKPEPEPAASTTHLQPPQRPSVIKRAWSSEEPKVDKFGRRILVNSPTPRSGASTANSIPGTPRRAGSPVEDDLERANTLMALYDIRSKLKQQDNSSLMKAREKINALAAKQQAHQVSEKNAKAAEESRRSRYSFPKPGL